jgi:hypothetical protein
MIKKWYLSSIVGKATTWRNIAYPQDEIREVWTTIERGVSPF